MKNLVGAVALALVMFGMSGGAEASAAEPPPPPYDWDGTAVDFAPFMAVTNPGGTDLTVYALYPDGGRRLCDYEVLYAELGPLNCRVVPISGQPDITQPGWIDEYAPEWAG